MKESQFSGCRRDGAGHWRAAKRRIERRVTHDLFCLNTSLRLHIDLVWRDARLLENEVQRMIYRKLFSAEIAHTYWASDAKSLLERLLGQNHFSEILELINPHLNDGNGKIFVNAKPCKTDS